METTREKIERVFRDLLHLIRDGQFTSSEVDGMEKFLDQALTATRKLKARIEETRAKETT